MKINAAALAFLLESKDGPVGLDLKRRADRITEIATRNAVVIFPSRTEVATAIGNEVLDGGTAVIGIRDEGRFSRYLAEKEEREHVWLRPALIEGLND